MKNALVEKIATAMKKINAAKIVLVQMKVAVEKSVNVAITALAKMNVFVVATRMKKSF